MTDAEPPRKLTAAQILRPDAAGAEVWGDRSPSDVSAPPPVPSDKAAATETALDPTRYGDWEKKGRCVDF